MKWLSAEKHNLTLHTRRLTLRPLARADLDAMAVWPPFRSPLDQEWNWPQRLHRNGMLDLFWVSHSNDSSRRAWTILERTEVIGLLQLGRIRRPEADARLGIALGAPWVGHGYGHEALEVFLPAYFGQLGFKTLLLEVALVNERAIKLYRRLGFHEQKRFWRAAETAHDYGFLEQPEYAPVRQYFRWANAGVYQLYAEMALNH